jgi:hypothetical protein
VHIHGTFHTLMGAYAVAADKTDYRIEKKVVESLVPSGHAAFGTICDIGRISHGTTFGILGRIKGTPKLKGFGTCEDYKYRSDDKIKEKAKVTQYQISSNQADYPTGSCLSPGGKARQFQLIQ